MSHVEKMKGNGTITSKNGEKVAAKYDIDCYQTESPAGHLLDANATIPGMKSFEGVVLPVCFFGETLTLEMQDSRKVNFFFKDGQGAIRTTGGIH
jgi:hypothetical protein